MSYIVAQSLATANISIGLVTIPVRLYSATQSGGQISFNLLHKACGTRVKQQYICPKEEVIVSRQDMVKGYEFAKDQFVIFTPEELKALEEQATQSIDISEFVPLGAVDPVYFDKPYYLAPEKGGAKAYFLLSEVMREKNCGALARYAARGKQYLVLVRAHDRGMVMQQLLYADEVRPFAEVPLPDVPKLTDGEMKLALQLVEQSLSETFNPGGYQDDVKTRIQANIQRKIEGHEIDVAEPVTQAPVIDLMEAIRASLKEGKGRKPAVAAVRGEAEVKTPAKKAAGGAARTAKGSKRGS